MCGPLLPMWETWMKLQADPALTVAAIWGVNQQIQDLSLSLQLSHCLLLPSLCVTLSKEKEKDHDKGSRILYCRKMGTRVTPGISLADHHLLAETENGFSCKLQTRADNQDHPSMPDTNGAEFPDSMIPGLLSHTPNRRPCLLRPHSG